MPLTRPVVTTEKLLTPGARRTDAVAVASCPPAVTRTWLCPSGTPVAVARQVVEDGSATAAGTLAMVTCTSAPAGRVPVTAIAPSVEKAGVSTVGAGAGAPDGTGLWGAGCRWRRRRRPCRRR
ncbi:hypothetical protein CMMCAS08_00220 [Clavibacter michiganensis subsp. michiganensis]|nr:hypothetical protein CMMCAS08_00220 [Clavibacter michiganensis subsp. michiganensis]